MNGLLNLTERERQLMLLLIRLDQSYGSSLREYKDVLSTDNRRILCKEANINKANLAMYAKTLIEKGALIKNKNGGAEVNPILTLDPTDDKVEYTFVLELEKNNEDDKSN